MNEVTVLPVFFRPLLFDPRRIATDAWLQAFALPKASRLLHKIGLVFEMVMSCVRTSFFLFLGFPNTEPRLRLLDEVTKLANEFLEAPVTFVQFPPLLDKFLQRFFCVVLFFVQCDAGFLESLDTRTEGRKVRIKALVSCNVLNPMA